MTDVTGVSRSVAPGASREAVHPILPLATGDDLRVELQDVRDRILHLHATAPLDAGRRDETVATLRYWEMRLEQQLQQTERAV